jgi:CheY-like chemotaxis protein
MDNRAPSLRELAHDLRDALSPLRAALDLMRLRGFAADVSSAMAQRIEQGLDRALATLDAFVLAEQCENGSAALAPVPVSLQRLLELTEQALPPALRERCLFHPPDAPLEIIADVDRSVQVLGAMLEQAAAAATAAPGAIEVQAGRRDQCAQVRVRFPGEPPAAGGEDWFASYRRAGGARLALRTARCLMALQQGNLQLVPDASAGCELVATFRCAADADTRRVSAPAGAEARHPAATAAPPAGAAAAGTRIMMVEDNAEVRRAYREALAALGYAVTEARNAEEALGALGEPLPAVALIDIHLPGMNGYRLAQALKARAGGAIRLVMLSGVTLDDTTLQLSKNAGFDQCFDKTAGPKALHALLRRLL